MVVFSLLLLLAFIFGLFFEGTILIGPSSIFWNIWALPPMEAPVAK